MKIYVWDNGGTTIDRYVVFIGQHVFNMSTYPDKANGINQYEGTLKSDIPAINKTIARMKFENVQIPKSLKYAIRLRCKEIRYETQTEHYAQ
jgi:hypothetical protein